MSEWSQWETGVSRALALFVAFAFGLLVLIILEAFFNSVSWPVIQRSLWFFFQLWFLVALPTVVSLRLLRLSPQAAWVFLGVLGLAAWYVPYVYCSERYVSCGSFDTFTVETYWVMAGLAVLAVAVITLHDYRKRL